MNAKQLMSDIITASAMVAGIMAVLGTGIIVAASMEAMSPLHRPRPSQSLPSPSHSTKATASG